MRSALCRLTSALSFALSFALAMTGSIGAARADIDLRFELAHLEPGLPAPAATLTLTDLFGDRSLPVTQLEGDEGTAILSVTLPEDHFDGPYARLRVVVAELELPPGDSKSGEEIRFAFEMILRRDLLEGPVTLRIPVVTTSRRQAMKPYMAMPDLVEDLPDRFFLAQQWMALYRASPEAVAAAPQAFALHRLISRAVVDFAIATAEARRGPVLILPAPELAQTLDLYWSSMPKGEQTHLAAYAAARIALWLDVTLAEDMLRTARRSGIEAPAACSAAREHLDFFTRRLPAEGEAAWVDALFPTPGTLSGYLEGRRLDILFACTRLRI